VVEDLYLKGTTFYIEGFASIGVWAKSLCSYITFRNVNCSQITYAFYLEDVHNAIISGLSLFRHAALRTGYDR